MSSYGPELPLRNPLRTRRDLSIYASNYSAYERKKTWRETNAEVVLRQPQSSDPILPSQSLSRTTFHEHSDAKMRPTANPTPIGICGFIVSLGPLSCDLIGWKGAGGGGAASIPIYLFFGGILMLLCSLLEYLNGNTFPFVVFGSFGAFWLSFGTTMMPQFYAYRAYAPFTSSSVTDGLRTPGFNASFGFFTLSMGILCLVYLICSLRINVTFVFTFFTLTMAFGFATTAYWKLGSNYIDNTDFAITMFKVTGGLALAATLCGWWIFLSLLLRSLDFPFSLPLGDLSNTVPRGSSRKDSDS